MSVDLDLWPVDHLQQTSGLAIPRKTWGYSHTVLLVPTHYDAWDVIEQLPSLATLPLNHDISACLELAPPQMWSHIPVEDPRAATFYDGHYSRQTVGARGLMGPGRRFLLWHENVRPALWGVCYALDPIGKMQFRNTIFRNKSRTLSSDLIRGATTTTYEVWERRYKELPSEPLTSEIGIAETAARRSKRHPPGHCYAMAGWELIRIVPRAHGRSAKAIYSATPTSDRWEAFARQWLLVGQWISINLQLATTAKES